MSATGVLSSTIAEDWLAIALTPGLGPTKARRLVEFFGSPSAVLRAPLTELEAAGIQAVSAQSLATGKSRELASKEVSLASAAGAQIVTLDDDGYPTHLKQIYDPPLRSLRSRRRVGYRMSRNRAVGTRHPTPYGSGMSERLSCDWRPAG